MKLIKFLSYFLFALFMASCARNTNNTPDQNIKKAVFTPAQWAAKAKEYKDVSKKWLATFKDPVMLKLIKEGKARNLDLQAAAGNMDKAWLLARKAGSTLKPSADLSLGGNRSGTGKSRPAANLNVGLTISWELDVWGRMKSGALAAEAGAQAARADYIFAQHSISANIAKTYLKVIEAKKQAELTRKQLKIINDITRITEIKIKNGESSQLDIAMARTKLALGKEQLIKIEGSRRDATRALEVLLGRYPNAQLKTPDVFPALPPSPPAGIPSKMLERRPDIVSAERKVAAAFNSTASARAAQLPRFSLTSTLSGSSNTLTQILNPANVAWQLAGNIVAPLYDGGRGEIDVKIATIEQKQAIAAYVKAALTAFSEVEKNLDLGQTIMRRRVALTEALKQSNKAYRIARLRYKEGESDLLESLTNHQQAISAESQLISIKRLELEQRINLYLALGGAW